MHRALWLFLLAGCGQQTVAGSYPVGITLSGGTCGGCRTPGPTTYVLTQTGSTGMLNAGGGADVAVTVSGTHVTAQMPAEVSGGCSTTGAIDLEVDGKLTGTLTVSVDCGSGPCTCMYAVASR